MIRNPAAHSNPKRRHFPIVQPYASQTRFPPRGQTMLSYDVDQYGFQRAQIGMHVATMGSQIKDGVANELSGAMKRHFTTTTHAVDRRSTGSQEVALIRP